MLNRFEMGYDLDLPFASGDVTGCISPASFLMPMDLLESAWHEHSPFAFWLMEAIQPSCFVELGTHTGFSYLAFCQAVQHLEFRTSCHAVDTWIGDDHAGFYGEEVFAALADINKRRYCGFSHLIRSLFDEALPYFPDSSIDLLHIDGRHAYEDVRHDFESWRPKLSEHGIVLFHDTNVRERDFGVWRLWSELAAEHPSFEFHHGHGLGVLAPGPIVPEGLSSLFASNLSQQARIRRIYARLGAAVHSQYDLQGSRGRTVGLEETLAALAERGLLLNSTIWRAILPARRAGASLPKPVRRAIRRLLRAVISDPADADQLAMIKGLFVDVRR
jgi:Methyltransferase domain